VKRVSGSVGSQLDVAQQLLAGVQVISGDFSTAIDAFADDPDVVFLADPPWPGAGKYEFTIDGRFDELINRLNNVRGRYCLIVGPPRQTISLARRTPNAYWGPIRVTGHEFVLSNFDLPFEAADLSRFGVV
jgi:hypothetical protein